MASTQQRRDWWKRYACQTSRMERYPFPRPNGQWYNLLVAKESVPVWAAVSQIMESEPYLFRETSGGTYNCREIGTTGRLSLHSYGIALDLNPSKNPHKAPLTTDMPSSFIKRMEGITANGVRALQWGGRWSKPDAMHYEIDTTPANCGGTIKWDKGDIVAEGPNGEPNWDEVSDYAKNAWTKAHQAGLLTDSSHPKDVVEVEQMMVYFARAGIT